MMAQVLYCVMLFMVLVGIKAEGDCKDILHGYLTGQTSSPFVTQQLDTAKKEIKDSIAEMKAEIRSAIRALTNSVSLQNDSSGGIVYTRWGRKLCPSQSSLVYSGYAGGSGSGHSGGAAEFVCLPRDPEWGIHVSGNDGNNGYMYGTEYEFSTLADGPRKTCYRGWKIEYTGYLMTGYHGHSSASEYICVDEHPESLNAGHSNLDGKLLYRVEAICGSLQCPPYVNGKELTCVVCSR